MYINAEKPKPTIKRKVKECTGCGKPLERGKPKYKNREDKNYKCETCYFSD